MAFTYRDMRVHFTNESSVFSVKAGWIAEVIFMLSYAYIAVQQTEYSCVQSVLAYGLSNN